MIPADCSAVAALLTKGFSRWRDRAFWDRALRRLVNHAAPAGMPQLGYVLEASGIVVGVLLMIVSKSGEESCRCNVSSWYVEPDYRMFGTLLVRSAQRHRDVTYVNVTPAPETWPVLGVLGYVQYCAGRAVLVPLLAKGGMRARVVAAGPDLTAGPDLQAAELDLLRDHARWGCLSLICETPAGRVPFVFGVRRRGVLKFGYLIYCRGLESVSAYARPLGLGLARHGIMVVVADADGKLPGVPGWFQDGYPKFFLGRHAPRQGDLAYTERAIFGA